MTASGVPCPTPVAASDPSRRQWNRVTRASTPAAASRSRKSSPVRIGPTVCELEGPMPMENMSCAETYTPRPDEALVTCAG